MQCGRDAEDDRAVVDSETGTALGGLCHRCERETFGICLEEGVWETTERCLFCSETGPIALPAYKLEINLVDGQEGVEDGHALTDETPLLCTRHANDLFDLKLDAGDRRPRGSRRSRPPNV
ncbi:hypothetical protein ACFQJD_12245 [Haloplanus sp. GCM10025708]|uniref:hypothetical protein n=1 Tax=Haloferacaceae TaxID=1644056 RepID=UPI003617EAC8